MMNDVLPEINDIEFVQLCYLNFLKRPGDESGKEHYLKRLRQGMDRMAVISEFIQSEEFRILLKLGRILLQEGDSPFLYFAHPGNYYSPLPSMREIRSDYSGMAQKEPAPNEGIDINEGQQLALLSEFVKYYHELPFPRQSNAAFRYYYENGSFVYFDAVVLYSFLRHYQPKRIIEVGAGFSSALMLDTNELFLGQGMTISFVEPYPSLLLKLMREADHHRHQIIQKPVQQVPLHTFLQLERNDILFVDSSHVVKFGSDLVYILFKVLPVLKPGVIIHFHDIFANFDYPQQWLEQGRAWNEAYFLRAYLSFNQAFKILLFNDFLASHHWDFLIANMPLCTVQPQSSPFKNSGVSLWIQKMGD